MTPDTPLYERLAGEAWGQVSPVVRAIHLQANTLEAEGTFRVTHGTNILAHVITWIARMPPPSDAEPIRLSIEQVGRGERWTRMFSGAELTSYQEERAGGLLAERFGLLELYFTLSITNSGIIYHQNSAALRFGAIRLKLPRWVAPEVTASETAAPGGDHGYVRVRVSAPLIGFLLGYEGDLMGSSAA